MPAKSAYRAIARHFSDKAASSSPLLKLKYERLAGVYGRLAEEDERNDGLIIETEMPPQN
jgi:hypothetical protein